MANLQVGVAGNGTVTVGAGASVHSPANNTLTLGTNGDERVRIDSNGKTLVGHSASRAVGNVTSQMQLEGTDASTGISICRNSNNAAAPYISLAKSRAGAVGGNTVIQTNDKLGEILFSGADGTDITNNAASINAAIDATPGSNDTAGRLTFNTTADGGTSPTERIRVYSDGCVGIGTMGADSRKDGHLQVETETTNRYAASFANHHASGSKGIRVTACDSDESNWIILAENRDGTNRFGVRGTGNVEVHDGDLVIGTANHGIDFSATGGPDHGSGTTEILDDYEQGTFTPGIGGHSGNPSYTASQEYGKYIKIGHHVHVEILIIITNVASQGSSNWKITNMPFTHGGNSYAAVGHIGYNDIFATAVHQCYIAGSNLTIIPNGVTQGNQTFEQNAFSTGYFGCTIDYISS